MYGVMLVDDEPYVREGLKTLINWQEYGFEVCLEADNGTTALELAEKYNPELIITDIRMPEINGLELIEKCEKQLHIKSKFIILSGYNDFEYARRAMKFGVSNYILKPIEEEEVAEALKKVKVELDRLKDYREVELTYMLLQSDNYVKDSCSIKSSIINLIGGDMAINIFEDNGLLGILVTEEIMNKFDYHIQTFARKIIREIFEKLDSDIVIYIGKSVKGLDRVKESRDSCMNALNTNFLIGKTGCISYEEMINMSINYDGWDNKIFDILMEAVEKNNVEKIYENIELMYKEITIELPAPEIVKANIAKFELEILKLISTMDGNVYELSSYISKVKLDSMLILELKEELKKLCIFAGEYINKLKENINIGIVEKVQKYIDFNYNKNIKLKKISEDFYINPIYLGQIFKKKIGISFKDYLNEIRIGKAEELLKDTDTKIVEVSAMVGFNDPNYFISKFERITKMTPTEYRKVCKNNLERGDSFV